MPRTPSKQIGYSPAVPALWSPTPADVGVALDQLAKRVQAAVMTTSGGGATATWVFPTPYSAPPVVGALAVGTGGQANNVELVSVTATQAVVRTQRSQAILILNTQPFALTAGITVHLIAVGN